jgi:peptidoglycan/LPS O-acetylase OafA/YrhL
MLEKKKEILTIPAMAHYWQRRFFRIYPLYSLYLLFGVITTWLFTAFLGINNYGLPFPLDWRGYLNHIFLQRGKGVTWSIAVEFKFYFMLPFLAVAIVSVRSYAERRAELLLRANNRSSVQAIGFVITMLFFLVLLLLSQVVFPQSRAVTNDPRLLPYMPVFLMGMFLAVIQTYTNKKGKYTEQVKNAYKYLGHLGVVGIIIMTPLVFSMFGGRVPDNYFHKQFILYSLFWSFVLLSSVNVRGPVQSFFTHPILRFFGALSFSLYLFHPIFLSVSVILVRGFGFNSYLGAWFVLSASTISAYISFRLLEGPVSKYEITRNSLSKIFSRIPLLRPP